MDNARLAYGVVNIYLNILISCGIAYNKTKGRLKLYSIEKYDWDRIKITHVSIN